MSLLRQVILILPLAFIFSRFDVNLIWLAFPIAEYVAMAVAIIFFFDINKKDFSRLSQ